MSGSSSLRGRAALRHVDRLLGQDRDQRVEELRRLDRLVEVRGEALAVGARLAPAERGEEDQRQRVRPTGAPGSPGRGSTPSISGMCMSRMPTSNGSPARIHASASAGEPVARGQHAPGVEVRGEDAPVGGVVVHDEHALAAERRLHAAQVAAGRDRALGGGRADREVELAARSRPRS